MNTNEAGKSTSSLSPFARTIIDVVRTVHPDGHFTAQVYAPLSVESWDENDTAGADAPTTLRRSGDISVLDAISILSEHTEAVLIDVRGEGEFVLTKILASNVKPGEYQLIVTVSGDGRHATSSLPVSFSN